MGGAAYNRGSLVISRQICEQFGCSGCGACREYRPTPRPESWGDKAKARALERARSILASSKRHGLPRPTVEMLTAIVQERERVGAATAQAAAEEASASIPA